MTVLIKYYLIEDKTVAVVEYALNKNISQDNIAYISVLDKAVNDDATLMPVDVFTESYTSDSNI